MTGGEEVPLCIVHLCVLLVASITSNSDCCKDLGGREVPLCMCVLLVAIASSLLCLLMYQMKYSLINSE